MIIPEGKFLLILRSATSEWHRFGSATGATSNIVDPTEAFTRSAKVLFPPIIIDHTRRSVDARLYSAKQADAIVSCLPTTAFVADLLIICERAFSPEPQASIAGEAISGDHWVGFGFHHEYEKAYFAELVKFLVGVAEGVECCQCALLQYHRFKFWR